MFVAARWQKLRQTYDLHLDNFILQLDGSDFEIDTNGADVRLAVGIVGKAKEQTRFTNTGISNQQQLEQIIIIVRHDGRHCTSWLYTDYNALHSI